MRPLPPVLVLASLAGCASSAPKRYAAELFDLASGVSPVVVVEVPGTWLKSGKGGALAFLGPDNFSKITLTAEPARLSPEQCQKLAELRVTELLKAAKTVTRNDGSPDDRRFAYVLGGNPESSAVGRAVCRGDAFATVVCQSGRARERQVAMTFEAVLDSLRVEPGL